jgi:hypothetical protein
MAAQWLHCSQEFGDPVHCITYKKFFFIVVASTIIEISQRKQPCCGVDQICTTSFIYAASACPLSANGRWFFHSHINRTWIMRLFSALDAASKQNNHSAYTSILCGIANQWDSIRVHLHGMNIKVYMQCVVRWVLCIWSKMRLLTSIYNIVWNTCSESPIDMNLPRSVCLPISLSCWWPACKGYNWYRHHKFLRLQRPCCVTQSCPEIDSQSDLPRDTEEFHS